MLICFCWAKFRTTKGSIKVHTHLDLKSAIPEFIHITPAAIHEVNVLDRGYTDFHRLYHIHQSKAFFTIRAKDNLNFSPISSAPADKNKGILCDQIIRINNYYTAKDYPEKLRLIKFYDSDNDRVLIFLTNNFELRAADIAQLYKHRWKIELFFKWIKQHLKIKSFWGGTENAVKTQIRIAISTYVLVAIAKKKFKLQQSLYEILQILSICIFDKSPIQQLFSKSIQQNFKELNRNQLNMFE